MTQVYSSPDWMMVQTFKSVLDSYGIPCEVRGEYRSSAMGEVPPTECWTELWVLDDHRVEEAQDILARAKDAPPEQGPSTTCRCCGERIEGPFDRCWKCGTARPDEAEGKETR